MARIGRKNTDDLLATAIAAGLPKGRAAKAAGVGLRTLSRRLSEKSFQAKVEAIRKIWVDSAGGRLARLMSKATKTLGKLLSADDTPPATRLGAARSVLEFALKTRELLSLEGRVAMLEAGHEPENQTGQA